MLPFLDTIFSIDDLVASSDHANHLPYVTPPLESSIFQHEHSRLGMPANAALERMGSVSCSSVSSSMSMMTHDHEDDSFLNQFLVNPDVDAFAETSSTMLSSSFNSNMASTLQEFSRLDAEFSASNSALWDGSFLMTAPPSPSSSAISLSDSASPLYKPPASIEHLSPSPEASAAASFMTPAVSPMFRSLDVIPSTNSSGATINNISNNNNNMHPLSSNNNTRARRARTVTSYVYDYETSPSPPPPTRSRHRGSNVKSTTYNKWSQAEDDQLRLAVAKHGTQGKWSIIAATIPGRTPIQCSTRWSGALNPQILKGKWSPSEDALLRQAFQRACEEIKLERKSPNMVLSPTSSLIPWHRIADGIPGRTATQCIARYQEALDPQIRKGKWSKEEDKILREGLKLHGKSWVRIASLVGGRTQRQCRTRWVQIRGRLEE
ncbi:hypothetical protein HDU97_007441 [Phlyctochytrium planicorne]|nr:hypothetical protein HDU97_007441 [Phlyctochytrium planicorne]